MASEADKMTLSAWRTAAIYPVLLLYISGYSMLDYTVNEYIQDVQKMNMFPNSTFYDNVTDCRNPNRSSEEYTEYAEVQEMTSHWIIYCSLALRVPSMLLNTILTSYTDIYGRRPLFIFTMLGSVLGFVVISFVIYLKLALMYIVIAYALLGVTGSFYCFLSVTFSFMADLTSSAGQRIFAVTVVEAFVMTCSVAGGLLNGVLVDAYGFTYPMIVCASVCGLALVIVVVFLPESHRKENREPSTSLIRIFKRTFDFYSSSDFKGQRLSFVLLITAFFFIQLNANNRSNIETLYLLGMPFCWKPAEIGYFTSVRYAAQGICGLGILKLFNKCVPSEVLAILSCLTNAGSFVQEALAKTDLALFLVAVPSIFSFLTIPIIRGLMSTATSAEKQGSLFASIGTVEISSALVATVSESSVYAATVAVSNSFVFFVMAGFCLVTSLLLCIDALTKSKTTKRVEYEVIKEVN